MSTTRFSDSLTKWLIGKNTKTLQGLIDTFAEKSFAVLFMILLSVSALPLPTGGVTHVLEVISMLLALELIVGFKRIWLPKKWQQFTLPQKLQTSTLPGLVKFVKKIEKHSKPRMQETLKNGLTLRLTGVAVLVFSLFAFVAPPFTGLDTLPSLGVVILSLGIILEDFLFYCLGLIVGVIGIGLVIGLGGAIFKVFFG